METKETKHKNSFKTLLFVITLFIAIAMTIPYFMESTQSYAATVWGKTNFYDALKLTKKPVEVLEHYSDKSNHYYLTTPYGISKAQGLLPKGEATKGDKTGGKGELNCTGFVVKVLEKCGANIGGYGKKHSGWRFVNWLIDKNANYTKYDSISRAKAAANQGNIKRGDLIWYGPNPYHYNSKNQVVPNSATGCVATTDSQGHEMDNHWAIYWGKVNGVPMQWHSAPEDESGSGNRIAPMKGKYSSCRVYVFTRPREGTFKIVKKTDDPNSKKCPAYTFNGIYFTLYKDKACKNKIYSFKIDKQGQSTTVELPEGTYYLKETSTVGTGYECSTKVHTVVIKDNQLTTATETNTPYLANLYIRKQMLKLKNGQLDTSAGNKGDISSRVGKTETKYKFKITITCKETGKSYSLNTGETYNAKTGAKGKMPKGKEAYVGFKNILAGKYTIKEELTTYQKRSKIKEVRNAIIGSKTYKSTYEVTLKPQETKGENGTIKLVNKENEGEPTILSIQKRTTDGSPVDGFQFKITRLIGNSDAVYPDSPDEGDNLQNYIEGKTDITADKLNNLKTKLLQVSNPQLSEYETENYEEVKWELTDADDTLQKLNRDAVRSYTDENKDKTDKYDKTEGNEIGSYNFKLKTTLKPKELRKVVSKTERPTVPEDNNVDINDANFPDKTFQEYVKQFDQSEQDNKLSKEEREAVTDMATNDKSLSGKEIKSLDGIEYFEKLQKLDCSNNELTNLDLSKNTELQELNCSNNKLATLDLSKNTQITENEKLKIDGQTTDLPAVLEENGDWKVNMNNIVDDRNLSDKNKVEAGDEESYKYEKESGIAKLGKEEPDEISYKFDTGLSVEEQNAKLEVMATLEKPTDISTDVTVKLTKKNASVQSDTTLQSITAGTSKTIEDNPKYKLTYNNVTWKGASATETLIRETNKFGNIELPDSQMEKVEAGFYEVQEVLRSVQQRKYIEPKSQSQNVSDSSIKNNADFWFEFTNESTSVPVKLHKTSEDQVIEGIEFTLTGEDPDGTPINRVEYTDAQGQIDFGNLYAGTYTITETGFDSDKYDIKAYEKAGYTIIKKEITEQVTETVEDENGQFTEKPVLDENGLPKTITKIKEYPSTTLQISNKKEERKEKDVYFVPDQNMYNVTFENKLKTYLLITKLNGTTMTSLAGATFTLKEVGEHDEDGDMVAKFTIEENEQGYTVAKIIEAKEGITGCGLQDVNITVDPNKTEIINNGAMIENENENTVANNEEETTKPSEGIENEEGEESEDTNIRDIKETWQYGVILGLDRNKKYRIEETNAPEGYEKMQTAQDIAFEDNGQGQKQNIIQIAIPNNQPEIFTTANAEDTNDHITYADDDIIIKDTIEFKNLIAGHMYTVKGNMRLRQIVEKEQEDEEETFNEVYDYEMADDNGNFVESEPVTFTADAPNGTVDVEFKFKGANTAGSTAVIYEYLYDSHYQLIAEHDDIYNEEQTVYIPKIHTTATDNVTKDHISEASEDADFIDIVAFEKLIPNKTYTVVGTLMDQDTEKPITDKDGKTVTASVTFDALDDKGEVPVEFNFNSLKYANKNIVVYETLYRGVYNPDPNANNTIIAKHEDINDKGQTIKVTDVGSISTIDKITKHPSSKLIGKNVKIHPPKTGDNTGIMMLIAVFLIAMIILVIILVTRHISRKKTATKENTDE